MTGPISTAVKDTTIYLQDKQFREHFEAAEEDRDEALLKVFLTSAKNLIISYGLEAFVVAADIIDVNDVLTFVKLDLQSIKERVGVKVAARSRYSRWPDYSLGSHQEAVRFHRVYRSSGSPREWNLTCHHVLLC